MDYCYSECLKKDKKLLEWGIVGPKLLNEAVNKFNLHADRIGQIVVTGNKETVFGNICEADMPKGLRSHGSEHERDVPIIGYNLKNKEFQFSEKTTNRFDQGRQSKHRQQIDRPTKKHLG